MNDKIAGLLHKIVNGDTLSYGEQKEIDEWVSQSEYNRQVYEEVMDREGFQKEIDAMAEYDGSALWDRINRELPQTPSFFRHRYFRYAVAAAVLGIITTTIYIFFVKPKPTSLQADAVVAGPPATRPDLPPGMEKAMLTLDNGTQLVLDTASNGKIAEEGSTIIVKEDGLLAYNSDSQEATSGKVFYNTLTTPRAGYYSSLVLADGSKVWLDAQSSIRFPTSFPGSERVVEIRGQAYFEVAKQAARPFKVLVKDKNMEVEVLGTHFNINAYPDEGAIRTSLLEGSVKVKSEAGGRKSELLIRPGEQAVLGLAKDGNGQLTINKSADMEEVIAWKSGSFLFKKEDLANIMRQVARWYDVDVVFEDTVPGHFVASLPRNVSVSRLLEIFEMAGGVKFQIDEANKKIIVRR